MCVVASFWPKYFQGGQPALDDIRKKLTTETKIPPPPCASGHPPHFSDRLRQLLLDCLDPTPQARSFLLGSDSQGVAGFTTILRDIILGYSLRKETGQHFWNKYFPRVKKTAFFLLLFCLYLLYKTPLARNCQRRDFF